MPRSHTPLNSNHPGTHFLRSPAVAARLVRSAGIGPQVIVLDLGAGCGAITAPLAETGARVLAIERNPMFVERLQARFGAAERVQVVHADALTVPLPRRRFWVVASIPFAISTPLLRRLLTRSHSRLVSADVIVEWGLAKRLTAPHPRTLETAWWSAGFELRLHQRIQASCFSPMPSVDAAHLAIRRRPDFPTRAAWALLHEAYAAPQWPARAVLGQFVGRNRAHRLLTISGIDPPTPAVAVTIDEWIGLARKLTGDTGGRQNRSVR